MATINMHDAKTQLSDLVARAEAGEDIIIARRNKPAVRLVVVDDAVTGGLGWRSPLVEGARTNATPDDQGYSRPNDHP